MLPLSVGSSSLCQDYLRELYDEITTDPDNGGDCTGEDDDCNDE